MGKVSGRLMLAFFVCAFTRKAVRSMSRHKNWSFLSHTAMECIKSREKYENSVELLADAHARLGLLNGLKFSMRTSFRRRNDEILAAPKNH